MIGETVKLGFDGTKVTRGLKGVRKGFGRLGRGIGSSMGTVGRGVGLSLGNSMFNAVSRVAMAIPNEIKSLVDLRQEFFALGDATGATVENMLALRQAIAKTSNVSPDMASKALQEMVGKIGATSEYGSIEFQALEKLGLIFTDLKGLDPVTQLSMISKGYRELRDAQGAEIAGDMMKDLMGGKLGKVGTPLFLNFESAMKRAKEETKELAKSMNDLSGELDSIDDIQIAFSNKMSELAMGVLRTLKSTGVGAGGIAEWINDLKVTDAFKGVAGVIKAELDQLKNSDGIFDYLGQKLAQLAKFLKEQLMSALESAWKWFLTKMDSIGEMITNSIKAGLPSFLGGGSGKDKAETASLSSGSSPIGGIFNAVKNTFSTKNDPNSIAIAENTSRTNLLLEKMTDQTQLNVYVK
tara:strand:+ start:227 stop:1456 length:1230 start_codon:yes stop_codon:yes gene_type:complete